ncbi:Phosphatidylinositol 4-kinase gamma 7 [Dionaea muscipula]
MPPDVDSGVEILSNRYEDDFLNVKFWRVCLLILYVPNASLVSVHMRWARRALWLAYFVQAVKGNCFFLSPMSPKVHSPVQTQMAVGVLNNRLADEHHGSRGMEGKKPTCWRRVFVQTETGCVLGMELDRSDNVHTVKRRLQVALNVPTDESSLTFGDMVLKNDLSAIRNDSPLLLTRNHLHRSSSTPCLPPSGKEIQQRDKSGPIEILGHSERFAGTRQLVKEIVKAFKNGVDPIPVHSGLGGAYYFRNIKGESVAIVKPTDEEPFAPNNPKGFVGKALGQPGLKRSVRVGETGVREVAAYLLDYDHFANVPATALVKITHSIFNVNDGVNGNKGPNRKLVSKIASFQQFIPHDFDASDHGTSSFPVSAVHRIGVLDIRILNTDRHAGNLLVRKLNSAGRLYQVELIPIDHGLCLPESLEDPYFEWIHWPQASIPFSEDEIEYIKNLDPLRDCEMLRSELPVIREACLRVLVLCTIFLKEAAANGLCLAEIGEMMSREFRSGEEEPSELEVVCIEARRLMMAEREDHLSPKSEAGDDVQFYIDCEDARRYFTPKMFGDDAISQTYFSIVNGNARNHPLSRLEESDEQEESENDGEDSEGSSEILLPAPERTTAPIAKLSMSLKGGETNQKFHGGKPDNDPTASSGLHRSAHELLPTSVSFVTLADLAEDEWALFLEKFQDLLFPAFAKRKSVTLGQKLRQRLGTSCQF